VNRRRRSSVALGILAVAASVVSAASASQRVAVDASSVTLRVDDDGVALITYAEAGGAVRHVLARPAGDGDEGATLELDRSGGWQMFGRQAWGRFRDTCGTYRGPPLVHLVAACTATDGTHWALQSWQRVQPLRGVAPFRPEHEALELRVSRWSGPLAALEVYPNWTGGGRLQGLFGRLTYRGRPVYGERTPSPTRSDPKSRYVYIDTYNSAYGPGWKREGAKVTHVGSGGFCFSFFPIPAPRGYPGPMPTVPGNGQRHRVTAVGPGLTPDIRWEGPGLGAYDPAADARVNAVFDEILGADRSCTDER
jgi:hypothetical protein